MQHVKRDDPRLLQTACSRPAGISASTSKVCGEFANWTRLEDPNTGNYLSDISKFTSLFPTTMSWLEYIQSRTTGSNIETEMTVFLSCALFMVSVSSTTYVLKQYIQKATTSPFRFTAYSQSSRNYFLHKFMTNLKSTYSRTLKCASHSSRRTLRTEYATTSQVP